MTAAVGVASYNPRGRRTGRIHRPAAGQPRRGDVPAACGVRVLFAAPATLTGWPDDVCHRCYPEGAAS